MLYVLHGYFVSFNISLNMNRVKRSKQLKCRHWVDIHKIAALTNDYCANLSETFENVSGRSLIFHFLSFIYIKAIPANEFWLETSFANLDMLAIVTFCLI